MKQIQFINIGYGNVVSSEKVVGVMAPDSAPMKRLINESKEERLCIDATYGRKTRSILIMSSGHIILTPLHVETVAARLNNDSKIGEGANDNG